MNFTAAKLLALIGCICFVLAVFSVPLHVPLVPLGLAFLAAAFVVT